MTRERFTSLWLRCLLDGLSAEPGRIFDDLSRRYAEPHRRYHTGAHVCHCLEELDQAANLTQEPHAVEMALWFHDAIYDPAADDNERNSAELFVAWADKQFERSFTARVYDLILVTTHDVMPIRPDEKIMVDIDLSSFGLAWPLFERDTRALREECTQRSDDQYFGRDSAYG